MRESPRNGALLHKRVEQFTRMLRGIEQGDVRALHRTRVASRRLREVLPILELDPDVARKLGVRLRKVTARLGLVRELDVLATLVDELQNSGHCDRHALELVAGSISDDRARARARLLDKMPVTELRRIAARLDKIGKELDDRRPSRGWRWALGARVANRAVALKEAIDQAGALYLPDRLHAVRIALKKLRYALELSAEAAGLQSTAALRTLKRDQDLLGHLHDRQVLIDRIRHLQASLHLDAILADLENRCRALHAAFVRDRDSILDVCVQVGPKARADKRRSAVS
jgi:CHAD domain-containing protein